MRTAEIYRAVLESDDILDAPVVDLPKQGTDRVIELFVVLREGAVLPRTFSGKVTEVPVKRILMGADPETAE